MGLVRGDSRDQGTLFPVSLDELVPEDHVCRVIDAFVESLGLAELGSGKARPAGTRPTSSSRQSGVSLEFWRASIRDSFAASGIVTKSFIRDLGMGNPSVRHNVLRLHS